MPWKSMVASIGTGLVNNALSQENAATQREWQEKMWKMQNAYNHPAAMADRMRSAGLNPYMMQGAEPAGSVGTGATAQTIPLDNPLAYAKVFAEIDNLAANTTKVDTENTKLLKDISMLDLLLERQFISNKEYEFKVKQYIDAWKDKNPNILQAENTEADTAKKKAEAGAINEQAKKTESDRLFTEALTATENAMRDVKVNLVKAQTAAANASAQADIAQASKLLLEGKTIELENERQALRNSAMEFYGFDPTTLPAELSGTLMNNFASVVEHGWDPAYAKKAMDLCHELLKTYRNKSIWTPTSNSYSWNNKFKLGDFEIGTGHSTSVSN